MATQPSLETRPARPEDALAADKLLHAAFDGREGLIAGTREVLAEGVATLLQTGHAFLLAEHEGRLAGLVRWREREGVLWFDLLAAALPGAGRELVRALEQLAQDHGWRSVRSLVPEGSALEDLARWWGYFPVGGETPPGLATQVVYERRLPLLTVRAQRRSAAAAIAALTGEDPWPFEQGVRPGWFVLADGDRVAGAISGRVGRDGVAQIREPAVAATHLGRGLEVWMVGRVALWASTEGAHRAIVTATPALERYTRAFEDQRWQREGDVFAQQLTTPGFE